jgi:hypothetical protein
MFIRMSGPLDRILTDRGRAAYKEWAQSALLTSESNSQLASAWRLQRPFFWRLSITSLGPDTKVLVLPPSYAIVSLAGFLCGCAAHLLIGMASFTALITKPRHLKLYPILPAHTPAIEEVSRITISAFVGSAIYSVLLLAPFVYWTNDLNLNSPDAASARSTFFALKLMLILACSIAALAVGVVPQIYISLAIQGTRRTTMLALLRRLKSNPRALREDHNLRLHDLFASVANSPTSTLGSGNIVEISVGVVAALLPLAVTVIIH